MINYFIPVMEADDQPKLSKKDQEMLVKSSNEKWHYWMDSIQEIRSRAIEARQLYIENRPEHLGYDNDDDAAQSLSRVRRPVLAQAIDSVIAQHHNASFPMDERFFKGQPFNEVARENVTYYEKHIESRLSEIDFMLRDYQAKQNKMLDCVSAVWHPAIKETVVKTTYEFPKVFGMRLPIGKPISRKKEKVVFEGTGYIPLSLEDWCVNPLADSLKETNLIARRFVSVEDLKAVKSFSNKDMVHSYSDIFFTDDDSNKRSQYEMMGIVPTYDKSECPTAKSMALLFEEWGDFCIEGKYYNNYVLIYSNDSVFHYFGPNPYNHQLKPFTVTPYQLLSGTLYGKSLAQDIMPLCHALDTLLNQGLDIISRTGNPTFTYLTRDSALREFFSDGQVSLVPGEGIPVDDHDSIRPIIWDRSAVQEVEGLMQRLKEEIRESTGGVPYTTGGVSELDQERTATETSILASGTNTRSLMFIKIDEELRLKPFLKMMYENDRQFMTEEVFVEDKVLTPNMIKMMDMSFDITGSKTVLSKSKELQELDSFINNQLPALLQTGLAVTNNEIIEFNIPEIIKRRLSMGSIRDIDSVMNVKTEEEQQEELMQQQQLGVMPNGLSEVPGLAGGFQGRDLAGA